MVRVSIDGGNKEVKVVTDGKILSFNSYLGDSRERKIVSDFGDPMFGSYRGEDFFAGQLAEEESYYPRKMMGTTKNHEDMLLRCCIAIHRITDDKKVKLVVNQPIISYTDHEKESIRKMLIGHHEIKLNHVTKSFNIEEVNISPEGASAYWSLSEQFENVTIVDVGSSTVNIAVIRGYNFKDRESDTLKTGTESNSGSIKDLSRNIISFLSKSHEKTDRIIVVGGAAREVAEHLSRYYPNTTFEQPVFKKGNGFEFVHPKFANAVGGFHIAEGIYND
jgi:plasmid segregation protein ParM